jgi:hypothetical protein
MVVVVVKIGEYQKIRNMAAWVTVVVANRGRMADRRKQGWANG